MTLVPAPHYRRVPHHPSEHHHSPLLVAHNHHGTCRGAPIQFGGQERESVQVSSWYHLIRSRIDRQRAAWKHAAKLVQKRLPESAQPTDAVLQPILARNAPKHPLHRIAYLKQSKGRWYTTHSQISAAVRRFTTSAARNSGVKYDKEASLPLRPAAHPLRRPFAPTSPEARLDEQQEATDGAPGGPEAPGTFRMALHLQPRLSTTCLRPSERSSLVDKRPNSMASTHTTARSASRLYRRCRIRSTAR